jgi:hypothetical protein
VKCDEPIERSSLDSLAELATDLAVAQGRPEWGCWILTLYTSLRLVPQSGVGEKLSGLEGDGMGELAAEASALFNSFGSTIPQEPESVAGLESLRRLAAVGAE